MDLSSRRPGDRVLFRVGHVPTWIRGTVTRTESTVFDMIVHVAERTADGKIVGTGTWPFKKGNKWDEERIMPDPE